MNLVIIESRTLTRQLLVMACGQMIAGVQIFSADSGGAGVVLCAQQQPALVLIDTVLCDGQGLEYLERIREAAREARVLVLASHMSEFVLYKAQKLGVKAIVDRNGQSVEVLQEALQAVLLGRPYFCSVTQKAYQRMKADPAAFYKVLSDREMEVLGCLAKGWSNEEVGMYFNLKPTTVRNHRQNILSKLGLGSTRQLISYAWRKGFVPVEVD